MYLSIKKGIITTAALLGLLLAHNSFASSSGQSDRIKIMTYNVENLFDTEHEPGVNDYQYLPIDHPLKEQGCKEQSSSYYKKACLETDWNEELMNLKMDKIKEVITAAGPLPDVLVLQEVENRKVLGFLAKKLGYTKYILEESQSNRGIDVGILYKETHLTYKSHYAWEMRGPEFVNPTTRFILAGYFNIKGQKGKMLAVYGNHWPSQAAPGIKRAAAAENLKNFIDQDVKRYGKDNLHVVALGDFNTTPEDWPAPFRSIIMNKEWDNYLYDSRYLASKARNPQASQLGTYFYPKKMVWHHLDRIFVSQNLADNSGVELDAKSYRVHQPQVALATYKYTYENDPYVGSIVTRTPKRWSSKFRNHPDQGTSDHFGLLVELTY